MESDRILTAKGDRYTVFSLWDTYRNVHQLLTLVYPERQLQMVRSMLDMYREHGWLPKWELYGRETLTMEGDPSIPVIVDTWLKGLRGFDVELAYEAMRKGAVLPGAENLLRPDNDDYLSLGYVPLREQYDNSVSHALEYYIADNALSRMAEALAKDAEVKGQKEKARRYKEDARLFYNRLWDISIITARSTAHSVLSCRTVSFMLRLTRGRAKTLNLIQAFMRGVHGTILSMFPTM